MTEHIVALDQGTSSTRAIAFAADGTVINTATRPVQSTFPNDGWVEQDPEQLVRTSVDVIRELLSSLPDGSVRGLGITNQRETTILWDKRTGRAVYPAIVWQDRRTSTRCRNMLDAGWEPDIVERTGLVIDPYFSSTKLAWLLDSDPNLRTLAAEGHLAFGTVDSFVIFRLCRGVHVTDATNASRTQLFNIHQQRWDNTLLARFEVPASLMPEVVDCAGVVGTTDPDLVGASIPVAGIAGDQQAALVGQACLDAGMSKSTYGTGCFAITNTGQHALRSENRLLTTVGYRLGGVTTYALEGSIFVAGAAVQWLRDKLRLFEHAADTEALAVESGGDTGGVFFVPAFTGLGAPHWDADARASISGLTLATNAAQVTTACLMSMGFQTADLIAAMEADGGAPVRLRVDGGMVVNDWLCQSLADLTNLEIERPVVSETTALGAARLAGLGIGMFDNLDEIRGGWRLDRAFSPQMPPDERARLMAGWRKAVDLVRTAR